jgi:hypothetical protein
MSEDSANPTTAISRSKSLKQVTETDAESGALSDNRQKSLDSVVPTDTVVEISAQDSTAVASAEDGEETTHVIAEDEAPSGIPVAQPSDSSPAEEETSSSNLPGSTEVEGNSAPQAQNSAPLEEPVASEEDKQEDCEQIVGEALENMLQSLEESEAAELALETALAPASPDEGLENNQPQQQQQELEQEQEQEQQPIEIVHPPVEDTAEPVDEAKTNENEKEGQVEETETTAKDTPADTRTRTVKFAEGDEEKDVHYLDALDIDLGDDEDNQMELERRKQETAYNAAYNAQRGAAEKQRRKELKERREVGVKEGFRPQVGMRQGKVPMTQPKNALHEQWEKLRREKEEKEVLETCTFQPHAAARKDPAENRAYVKALLQKREEQERSKRENEEAGFICDRNVRDQKPAAVTFGEIQQLHHTQLKKLSLDRKLSEEERKLKDMVEEKLARAYRSHLILCKRRGKNAPSISVYATSVLTAEECDLIQIVRHRPRTQDDEDYLSATLQKWHDLALEQGRLTEKSKVDAASPQAAPTTRKKTRQVRTSSRTATHLPKKKDKEKEKEKPSAMSITQEIQKDPVLSRMYPPAPLAHPLRQAVPKPPTRDRIAPFYTDVHAVKGSRYAELYNPVGSGGLVFHAEPAPSLPPMHSPTPSPQRLLPLASSTSPSPTSSSKQSSKTRRQRSATSFEPRTQIQDSAERHRNMHSSLANNPNMHEHTSNSNSNANSNANANNRGKKQAKSKISLQSPNLASPSPSQSGGAHPVQIGAMTMQLSASTLGWMSHHAESYNETLAEVDAMLYQDQEEEVAPEVTFEQDYHFQYDHYQHDLEAEAEPEPEHDYGNGSAYGSTYGSAYGSGYGSGYQEPTPQAVSAAYQTVQPSSQSQGGMYLPHNTNTSTASSQSYYGNAFAQAMPSYPMGSGGGVDGIPSLMTPQAGFAPYHFSPAQMLPPQDSPNMYESPLLAERKRMLWAAQAGWHYSP